MLNKNFSKMLFCLIILAVGCIPQVLFMMFFREIGIFSWLRDMPDDFFLLAYATSYSVHAIAIFYLWIGFEKWMKKKGMQTKYLFARLYITMAILAYCAYRYTAYKERSIGVILLTIVNAIIVLVVLELHILRCLVLKIKQKSNLSYASFVLLGASVAWFMIHGIVCYLNQKHMYYIIEWAGNLVTADCVMGFIGAVVWGIICAIKMKRQKNNVADTEKLSVRKGVLICILSVVMLSFSLCKFIGYDVFVSGQWW